MHTSHFFLARLACLLAVPIAASGAACSSSQSSDAADSGADTAAPTEMPGDVGKSCNAGCDKDLCVVTSYPNCASGDCLLDARKGLTDMDSYCTGDCRAAACPAGFACQAVPSALTGESLQRCVKDGTAPKDAGSGDAAKKDAGPTAVLAACEYTRSGCSSVCAKINKGCSTHCPQFGGAMGQTFANESSCNALSGAVDDIAKCGATAVADWIRCCCE